MVVGDFASMARARTRCWCALQALGCPVIQGNTDRDLVQPTPADTDAGHAALLDWTRERIGPAGLDYLASLPFSHQVPDPTGQTSLLVVHANPRDLDTHLRPAAPEETILPLIVGLPAEVTTLAFGHLHIPYTRRVGGILLADISSAGLPKDGDRRAGYGLLTWQDGSWQVEQRRVDYPVDEVVAQLRAADPPGAQQLIRQLLRARYPNMAGARGGRLPARRVARPGDAAPAVTSLPAPVHEPESTLVTAAQVVAGVAPAPEPAEPAPAENAPVAPAPDPAPALIVPASVPEVAAVAPEAKSPKPDGKRHVAKKKAKAAKPEFEATDNFPWILPRVLEDRLAAVLSPMATVREDEDPEGVHDMRVAIRRLRGALEPAEPFYPPKAYKRALRRVKALARALGHVRDADVHLISLRKRLNRAAPEEQAGIAGLIDTIVADRAGSRADLDPILDQWEGPHADHLVEVRDLLAKARGRKQKDRTRDSVAAVALRALAGRLAELGDVVGVLSTPDRGDPEELHAVRIVAKRLRYTLELFSPVLGPDIEDLLAEFKTLQDLLGELHDRDVMVDLLQLERVGAAERQLEALARAALEPGSRAERLASVRADLADPAGFAATATGIYGLLIDILDERASLETQTRERWASLTADGFLDRLWSLTDILRQALDELAAPHGDPPAAAPAADTA
ncbi:MAG: CHAD domain-containing protein [Thermomicrobiales bacterium]